MPKKIALTFLLLFFNQQMLCQSDAWLGQFDKTIVSATMTLLSFSLAYMTINYGLQQLLLKTQNPYIIKFILLCLKKFTLCYNGAANKQSFFLIPFSFNVTRFYWDDITREKPINMPLVNELFKAYEIEAYACSPQGCLQDPLYLAVREGNVEFLTYLFSTQGGRMRQLKDKNCNTTICNELLHALLGANDGTVRYIITLKALLKKLSDENITIHFHLPESLPFFDHPLVALANHSLNALQDDKQTLFESYQTMFSLLLDHKTSDQHNINNFAFEDTEIFDLAKFLSLSQNIELRRAFLNNQLTKQEQRQTFCTKLQKLSNWHYDEIQAFHQELIKLLPQQQIAL